MRFPPVVLLLMLAGCSDAETESLAVTNYDVGPPRTYCCIGEGQSYYPVQCPDGDVHSLTVHTRLLEAEVGPSAWRLVWDDGHRTGVGYADGSRRLERVEASLMACRPQGAAFIEHVHLVTESGEILARGLVPVASR